MMIDFILNILFFYRSYYRIFGLLKTKSVQILSREIQVQVGQLRGVAKMSQVGLSLKLRLRVLIG